MDLRRAPFRAPPVVEQSRAVGLARAKLESSRYSRIGPLALLGYGASFGALLLMHWLGM